MNMILWAGLAVASAVDWRFRKIPNWLTLFLAFIAFIFHALTGGSQAFLLACYGFLFGIVLLYLPFAMGGMGGGDVKLLAAIGAFVGPGAVIQIFLASMVIGGVFCAIALWKKKAWKRTMQNIKNRVMNLLIAGKVIPESEVPFSSAPFRIPYALTMMLGYFWIYFTGGH